MEIEINISNEKRGDGCIVADWSLTLDLGDSRIAIPYENINVEALIAKHYGLHVGDLVIEHCIRNKPDGSSTGWFIAREFDYKKIQGRE